MLNVPIRCGGLGVTVGEIDAVHDGVEDAAGIVLVGTLTHPVNKKISSEIPITL